MAVRHPAKKPSPPGAEERFLVEAAQADPSKFDALYELHFERIIFSSSAASTTAPSPRILRPKSFTRRSPISLPTSGAALPSPPGSSASPPTPSPINTSAPIANSRPTTTPLTRLRPPLPILPQKSWSSSTATPFSSALSKSFPKFSAASSANASSKSAASKKSPNA